MRLKSSRILLVLGFCVSLCPELYAFVTTPPRVRFTGVLVEIKDQARNGLLEDLDVTIAKERRTFLLDKMEIIGAVGINRRILQRLFPPSLHIVGPDNLTRLLKSQEVLGKVFTIEGLLYTTSRTFFLIGVAQGDKLDS